MFFRRKALPNITQDGYSRWLRAQRPPFEWFSKLSELEQEALATIGDSHASELVEGLAMALGEHEAVAAGVDVRAAVGGDAGVEETLARQLAAGMAAKLSQGAQETKPAGVRMPTETLAGLGERKTEEHDHGRQPRLFGREADAR